MTNDGSKKLPIWFTTPAAGQDFEGVLATAQAAEASGFSGVSFSDRPHDPILDGWTLAAAVAARTDRVRLHHSTLNIPYRFPAVLAKEAATLDIISNGRLDLCLGAGGEENRALYDSIGVPLASPSERMQDLVDAIAILRGLWSNEKFSFKGRVHELDGAAGGPQPVQDPIPIWVGARLPRSLRLAGSLAEGFMKNRGWTSLEEMAELNQKVDSAAAKAGRDPGKMRHVINGPAYIAQNRADSEAFRTASAAAAPYQPGGLIGTVDEVITTIRDYSAVGVDVFGLRFRPEHSAEQIRLFGSEVIPAAGAL